MKTQIWDSEGVLTKYGKTVQDDILKAVKRVLKKHGDRLDGNGLRGLEHLWAGTIMLPVAMIVASRRGAARKRRAVKGGVK